MLKDIMSFNIKDISLKLVEAYGEAFVLLLIGLFAIHIVMKFLHRVLKRSKVDEALYPFISKSVRIVLLVVLVIMILTQLGVRTTSLVTILGAASAAIALALRDSLSNVAGGLIILVNKPFSKGDIIDLPSIDGDTMGKVDQIDLLTTRIRTFDNKVITIPNGTIITSILTNYSMENERRVDCIFGIGYDADIDQAKDILKKIAASCPQVFEDKAPHSFVIGVSDQGDSAVMIDLKVWCATDDYFVVKYYLEEQVKLEFDKAGISIPYPQMDVHIKSS